MLAVSAFDLETCSVGNHSYCETYAAGVYHLNRLYECFNGDLTDKGLEIERQHVHVFDRENGNPMLDMINYVVHNFNWKPKFISNKYNRKIISSYKYQIVGNNAGRFVY